MKYTVRMKNMITNQKVDVVKGIEKEEAMAKLNEFKTIENEAIKFVLVEELDSREEYIDHIVYESACDIIGGFENAVMDGDKEVEKILADYDVLFAIIYDDVMRETQGRHSSYIRFAGKEFIKSRIEKRMKKFGYEK